MTQAAGRAQAAQDAMREAVTKGSTASARAINGFMASLTRAAETAGKTRTEIMGMRAAQLGVADTAQKYIQQIADAAKHTDSFSLASHGAQRELLVMAHELSQGNFSRFAGSMMVLGERTGGLAQAVAFLAGPLGVAAVAMGAFAVAAVKGAEEARQFAAAVQMTSNYAGLTADSFAKMTATVSGASGSGLGQAAEVLRNLASSGQYTSEQMRGLATVMLDTSRVTGQSLADVSKLYEGLAQDPARWASEHISSMHNMNVATLEHIEAMQQAGDKYAAFDAVVESLLQQVQDSSQQHLSAARSEWEKLTASIESTWAAMKRGASGNETIADQINDLKRLRDQVAANPDAVKGYDEEISALERQRRQLQQNADQLSAYQQVQQQAEEAEQRVEKMRDQFATNAEKRAKELAQLQKDRDAIVAGGGSMPDYDQRVADINDKYKDRAPKSQVSSINADASSALQLQKLAEQQAQQQLQFQRSMGLVSAENYYRQLHDIEAKALQAEIDTEQKRVNALSKFQGSAAYTEAAGKLAELKQRMSGLDTTRDDSIAESRRQDSLSAQQFQFGLNDEVRNQQAGFSHSESTQFMSAQMQQEYDQRYQIIEQFEDKVQRLKDQYSLLPADKQAELQGRLQSLQQAKDTELQQLRNYLDQQQTVRDSFSDQMTLAMTKLSGNGQTAAQATAEAFTQAWQDSTNALNTFLTTGKGNFDQFATGVLADMAKIALQFAEMQAMQGLLSMFGNGSGAMSGLGTLMGGAADSGITYAASGGHITGPGSGTSDSVPAMLSNGEYVINASATKKYRGLLDSINTGNLSHFATGGAVGSVGAASSSSADGGASNPVNITVHNSGSNQLTEADARQMHRMIQDFVDARINYQARRQGGIAYQIRYNQI